MTDRPIIFSPPMVHALLDLTPVREALHQCAEAMDLFFASYPHMTKGYILDACDAARAALALIDGENGNG